MCFGINRLDGRRLQLLIIIIYAVADAFTLERRPAFVEKFGNRRCNGLRRDLFFLGQGFDSKMPLKVAFQNAPLLHSQENGLGPIRILMKLPPAPGAAGDFPSIDEITAPGFQKLKNVTLIRIHTQTLSNASGNVEKFNRVNPSS